MAANGTDSPSPSSSSKPAAASAAVSKPWTNIVHNTAVSEPIAAAPVSSPVTKPAMEPVSPSSSLIREEEGGSGGSENVSSSNDNVGKRAAWRSPSNGPETGASVETQSWPALAESVKAPAKLSSDSVRGLADGLSAVSVMQVSGFAVARIAS